MTRFKDVGPNDVQRGCAVTARGQWVRIDEPCLGASTAPGTGDLDLHVAVLEGERRDHGMVDKVGVEARATVRLGGLVP